MPQLIPKMVHRCIIERGNLAGNTHEEEVSYTDIKYGGFQPTRCSNCGEDISPLTDVIAHLYEHLTEDYER